MEITVNGEECLKIYGIFTIFDTKAKYVAQEAKFVFYTYSKNCKDPLCLI